MLTHAWLLRVDPVQLCVCVCVKGEVRLWEGASDTPVASLPGLRMFWTILGSSFVYNIGLPSLGLLLL